MKEKICTFCGHRIISEGKLREPLKELFVYLIEKHGFNTFYSGAMGEFDRLCHAVIHELKPRYPHIKLCRILYRYKPYEEYAPIFDETLFPDLEGVHYKKAITFRNRFMVDSAKLLVCFVSRNYGGACDTMRYAEKCGVPILNLHNMTKETIADALLKSVAHTASEQLLDEMEKEGEKYKDIPMPDWDAMWERILKQGGKEGN